MKLFAINKLLCMAYQEILRDLLLQAIDDPDEEWDDMVIQSLDRLFNYTLPVDTSD